MENPFYNETYKANALKKIREYSEKYKKEYKDTGKSIYFNYELWEKS